MTTPLAPPVVVLGEGSPVILLHAFPLDGRIWMEHASALSGRYRMIVPDLRGFGSAADQLGDLTNIPIDLLADDLAALLDERGIDKAVIGGISRGGFIALAFARKHPQHLRGLMLFDTRATAADEKEQETYSNLCDRLITEGIEAAVDVMKPRLLAPATLAGKPALVEQVNAIIRSQQPQAVAAGALGMIARADARPFLDRIKVPTLAIAGVADAAFEQTEAIAAAIPGAKFVSVPDAGHLSIMEQPQTTIAAMHAFLDEITE